MNTKYNNNVEGALKLINIDGKIYQIGKDASATEGGIAKLYTALGTNTDGSVTQAAIKSAIESASGDVASDLSDYIAANDAKIGTVPEGKTVVEMISDAQSSATYDDTALASRVSANEGDIATLKGGSSVQGSVAYQIAQIVNENNNGTIDTLNEIASWIVNDTTGAAKMASDISELSSSKADKVASATNGNFAALDANGNLTDSGKKASDFQAAGNYKTTQTAKSSPSASGNATAFIDTISQNAQGVITATKKNIPTATASTNGTGGSNGLMSAADKEKLDGIDYSGKADKVSSATAGDFAGLDANGNLTDSGKKASDFATAAQGAKADSAVQDASYVHTDNNYTTSEKNKLAAISASVSGDTLTITTQAA